MATALPEEETFIRTRLAAILVAGLPSGSSFALPRAFAGETTDVSRCKKQLMAHGNDGESICACMKAEDNEKSGAIVADKVYRMGGVARWRQQEQSIPDPPRPQMQLSGALDRMNEMGSDYVSVPKNDNALAQLSSLAQSGMLVPVAGQIDSSDTLGKEAPETPSHGHGRSTVPKFDPTVNYLDELVTVRDKRGNPVADQP